MLTIAGVLVIFVGVALLFVKVDKAQLEESKHSMPGLAIFRFDFYRYGIAVICVITGLILIAAGFDLISLE